MANWNRWGIAAGLAAGALALCGTAWAQTPGAGSSTSPSPGTAEPGTGTQGSAGSAAPSASGSAGSTGSTAKVDPKLQEHVQKLHAENQAEVHMGEMGEQQASSPEVKQFAQRLHQDHQQLDAKLTQTAQAAGITLEGKAYESGEKSAQKEMQKLQGKSGADFDKAFVQMMVKDHEKDIKATQEAAKEAHKAGKTELASLLDQAVVGMQGHLKMAKDLEHTVGKGKSAHGSSSSSTGSGSSGSTGEGTTPGAQPPKPTGSGQ
jgi:putative membrane protein